MNTQLIPLGILVVFIGFILIFVGALSQNQKSDSKTKVAVGGFIGFIPFGFGNDKEMVKTITIISIVFFVLWIALQLILNQK